jgi:phosphoribosylformylglycinamidine cyclo-ligase
MALTRLKPNNDDEAIDYEASGVSSKRAHEGLNRLTSQITQTWRVKEGQGRVWLELGHFANVVEIGQQGIAFCTDGVGSKSLIAQRLKKYDTIGIDCVAMNVNDLICVGATPISMVDYIAIERADPQILEELSIGLRHGANEAGISVSGGEIAQLPGIICGEKGGCAFDLVGAAIGHVALSEIITGQDVQPGDVIIGTKQWYT